MSFFKKLSGDFVGLLRVLGPLLAIKWAAAILVHLPSVVRAKNLQRADQAMGDGPFNVRIRGRNTRFRVAGRGAFSGIREMYVRDTYLRNGLLTIEDADVVLDLGANMGNFTNLALASGKSVQVVSVEPGLSLNNSYKNSVTLNDGFIGRTQLVRAFVGLMANKQDCMLEDEQYIGAEWISEDELIVSTGLSKVDFLKCDIEGGEFGLLHPKSKLLQMTRKLAVEVHHFAGDVDGFLKMLVEQGFEMKFTQRDPDGTATFLGIRP